MIPSVMQGKLKYQHLATLFGERRTVAGRQRMPVDKNVTSGDFHVGVAAAGERQNDALAGHEQAGADGHIGAARQIVETTKIRPVWVAGCRH